MGVGSASSNVIHLTHTRRAEHLASRRRQIEEPMDALVLAQRKLGKQKGA